MANRAHLPNPVACLALWRAAAVGFARTLLFATVTFALGACTIVQVSDGAAVRTAYYPGLAVVRVAPGRAMQVVDVQALGPAIVGNQASLGWLHSQMALIPPGRCQFIAWRFNREQSAALRRLFGQGTEICDQEGETQ